MMVDWLIIRLSVASIVSAHKQNVELSTREKKNLVK